MWQSRKRRNRKGNAIAEFGPALWVFFVLIIIPLIDMASFLWGVGTVMLAANLGVKTCAGARTYSEAINLVNGTETDLATFRSFAIVTPTGGAPRGVRLQVIGYPVSGSGGATVYPPPPAPNRIPVDRATLDNNMYEYQCIASYDVQPLFNFNGLPVFGNVPGLGTPVPVSFTATATVEHPEGLND
jgi:hypothetical protein